jgi:hypothetical protein
MMLWEEYFLRHKMPLISPYPPFIEDTGASFIIRPNPPQEHRRWVEFIVQFNESLRSNEIGQQAMRWGSEITQGRLSYMPSLREQQSFLFHQIPAMEVLWHSQVNRVISWSCSDSLRDSHRILTSPIR